MLQLEWILLFGLKFGEHRPPSYLITNLIDFENKRLKTMNLFEKFKIIIKKSKTYKKACPYLGLSIGATLGLI